MRRQSANVVIARPVADVVAYMDDVTREHEWQPSLASASQEPPGPTGLGTRKSYSSTFMGRRVENTYVVTALDPGVRVVYETTKDSAIRARSEISWESVGSGTRVTMTIVGEPGGALRLLPKAVMQRAFGKELENALARLKERLESRA